MPDVKGSYAMNPAVARRKAADTESPDEDLGELESMEVRPAENGYTVRNSHKPAPKKGKGKDKGDSWQPNTSKEHVFESADAAVGHIAKHLKKHSAAKGKKK